jgi:hypothetical protein
MIWAKIVNNEIMQTHDENPAGLWHPDAIAKNDIPGYWEEVPDHVNVGWKFKNDEWISGGQWMEEHAAEAPIVTPGEPFCRVNFAPTNDPSNNTFHMFVDATISGIYDTWSITIGDTVYSSTVTAASSTTNEFTCETTEWLKVKDQITFMGTLGGVEKHKAYLVHSVVSATKFKICDMYSPLVVVELTTETGTMMMSRGPDFHHTIEKTSVPQPVAVSITTTGPGGTSTDTLENDMALIVPEIWVPLFAIS